MKLSGTNGRGLDHFSTWPRVRDWDPDRISDDTRRNRRYRLQFRRPALGSSAPARCRSRFSSKILVTLAERPYPFPSRTRKSSSPAPKILRGQPFGNIGRRQDFVRLGPGSPERNRSRSGPAPGYPAPVMTEETPASDGAYRMSVPDREHRCAAFVPPTSLALAKQARLCLTANHPGCATYIASISARQARVGSGERRDRAGRWGIARTMPVIEEVGGLRATLGALLADRRTWPAIPAVLLATLLLALGLSGSWAKAPPSAVASPTPTPRLTPHPT